MQENIAKTIREGWSPKLREAMKLPEQAQRLDRALRVAEKWMDDAREESSEMWAQAQYTRDKLEEELARVCFEMRVEDCERDYGEGYVNKARSDELSNALLEAFCALSAAPSGLFRDGSRRVRYGLMGALMVAMDATNVGSGEALAREPEKQATA